MIVTKNIGRTGNNLFQIAASFGYAKKYGYEWAADEKSGVGEPYSSIHQTFPNLPKTSWGGGSTFKEHPNNNFCHLHNTTLDNCHFNYHPIPNFGPNLSMIGFFQSWRYFEGFYGQIRKLFEVPHVNGFEDYVSIHVRRGDYVQHSGSFPPIDMDYLSRAMARFPDRKFIIFSDDIAWCKENIKGEFSEGRTDLQDLSLMASCGDHIIANSTFSWWGAYLGHNPDRQITSPSHVRGNWFGMTAGVKQDVIDLIPPEWTQIKFR